MKKILFRADSSSIIGTGHIMRDLVLAQQFKGASIIFATQNLVGNINHKIEERGYIVEMLSSNDIKEVVNLISEYSIDMIIIDHYQLDYNYEKELKLKTGVEIFVLDDTYTRHYCDILLNHNIGTDIKKYANLVPEKCELRCGDKYTLLRDEFIQVRKKRKKRKKNIFFVAMGGADPFNYNIKLLRILSIRRNIQVHLVTTTANPNLEQLSRFCCKNKWVKLHINSTNMAYLMKNSDFAIVTPSVTVHEVQAMSLPFLAIKTSENQEYIYQYLKSKRFCVLERFNIPKIRKLLCKK